MASPIRPSCHKKSGKKACGLRLRRVARPAVSAVACVDLYTLSAVY